MFYIAYAWPAFDSGICLFVIDSFWNGSIMHQLSGAFSTHNFEADFWPIYKWY